MLLQLEFKNLATFPVARLEFSQGLNILSGMSGAGKSVLLKALGLVLGGRFSQKLIREGQDKAEVSALFILEPHLLEVWRDRLDLKGDEILIQRQFRREGRSINYLNDAMIGSDTLQQLGATLAQTLDQDEALGLRDPWLQLQWLDTYGEIHLETYRDVYRKWKSGQDRLQELQREVKTQSQQRQFMEFQYEELRKINLREGELAELEEEHQLLAHSVEIDESVAVLCEVSDTFSNAAMRPLEQLLRLLKDHAQFSALIEEGRSLQIEAEEWSRALRASLSNMEADPARLMEVETRLRELRSALKKFHMSEAELVAHVSELELQLTKPPAEIEMQKLEKEVAELEVKARQQALKLDQWRGKVALQLSAEINKRLATLEMDGDRFSIQISQEQVLGPKGMSKIDFLLKPTAEGPSMTLAECASGGERSRALLAISSALAKSMKSSLLVFDEIDTNIGSRLGRPISEAFLSLAEATQVICVTHLAPVAACGDKHFMVEKGTQHSLVRELLEQERLSELAQMIAGEKNSKSALEQAEHMLKQYRGCRA